MSKSTITRKQALENALIFCNYANVTALTIEGNEGIDWVETANVLAKMHEQVAKPRAKAVSKARLLNEGLAVKVAKQLPAEGLSSKGIVELGIPEVATTQKAVAVMRVAEEVGLVERVKDKKTITYKPVTDATPKTFFPVAE